MTREETVKLMMMIQAAYPNYKPAEKSITVNMWHLMFEGYDFNLVQMGLQAYITSDTSGFAPSIGQIMNKIRMIDVENAPKSLSETEAWSLVSRALRNSAYHSSEEFEKLPEEVKKAVGSPHMLETWAKDENYNESVVSSNFMRSYKQIVKRNEEYMALPSDVRKVIEIATQKQNHSQALIGGE